ncbi:amino acid ABC transporter permease [Propionicicella superfundia]|uniref:amino acid ABC transporter permease n=1 Tax=Propionicicella superfundia TaxID=348582 RepID=UPI000429AF1A|nr:amino acid ABC transporter permease [Propionicicella superfundia]
MSAPALFDAPGPKTRALYNVFTVVALAVVAVIGYVVITKMGEKGQLAPYMWEPFLTPVAWVEYLIPGLLGTLRAAATAIVLALVFGLLFGMGRLSRSPFIRIPCGLVVEFFRAVPVLIMVIFAFGVYSGLQLFGSALNPFIAVVTALTLYNGSLIAELVRSGVNALPKGQSEAGLSIGLTRGQTLRQIQLPQALTAMLPALIGQTVVILKDSALGYSITYLDLLNWSKTLGSAYGNTIPAYIVAAGLFITLNYLLTRLASLVEHRLRSRGRTAGAVTQAIPAAPLGPPEGEEILHPHGHQEEPPR